MTATTRRKLAGVLMATVIFGCLGAVTTAAVGRPVEIGTMNAILIGAGIGLFEEFYVQGPRGNAMRAMHPMRSIFIYIVAVMVLYLVALHITHVVLGRLDDLPVVYRRLPYGLAFFTAFSIVGILMMRVAHFIGLRSCSTSSSAPIIARCRNAKCCSFSTSTARPRSPSGWGR
jgi:adenylate cyclase